MNANIFINNVPVGSLPASEYQQIIHDAYQNRRLYLEQAGHFLAVIANTLIHASSCCFMLLVLLMGWDAFFDTAALTSNFEKVRQTTPVELISGLRMYMVWCGLSVGLYLLLELPKLLSSAFKEHIHQQIRQRLGIPASGEMTIRLSTLQDAITSEKN